MARKKRKTRQERGVDPEQEIIEEDSKEAIEAAEKLDAQQQEAMADLLDDSPQPEPEADKKADPVEEPKTSEKPAQETEPQSQPEEEAQEPDIEAKAEEQPPGEEQPEPEAKVPDESKPKEEKPTEEPAKEPSFITGDKFDDYSAEVVSDEGAKVVPLKNLVITYGKYGQLQQKYQEVKPLLDLTAKANCTVADALGFIELGIHAYNKQQGIIDGTQPPVAQSRQIQPQSTDGYQGPFKDTDQDAYYKEVDPDHHAAMHNMYRMIQSQSQSQGGGRVAQLEQEVARLKEYARPHPEGAQSPSQTQEQQEAAQKAFDEKILSWSGDHTDYFSAKNIGSARLDGFKQFIIRNHRDSGLKINDLTSEFLAAEFARFDPRYNLEYMTRLASKKAVEGKDESGMFAEGSGKRSQAEPLDDQQKHMADLL